MGHVEFRSQSLMLAPSSRLLEAHSHCNLITSPLAPLILDCLHHITTICEALRRVFSQTSSARRAPTASSARYLSPNTNAMPPSGLFPLSPSFCLPHVEPPSFREMDLQPPADNITLGPLTNWGLCADHGRAQAAGKARIDTPSGVYPVSLFPLRMPHAIWGSSSPDTRQLLAQVHGMLAGYILGLLATVHSNVFVIRASSHQRNQRSSGAGSASFGATLSTQRPWTWSGYHARLSYFSFPRGSVL